MAEEKLYDLLKIGLTEGEAKVYLALMELGSSTVGPIVKKAHVAYSNVYDILQRLMEKGIVSYIIKNKTKYFQAVSPSNLYKYLEEKEKSIQEQKEALQKALPTLQALQTTKPQQEAEILLGKKGLRTAYEQLLASGQEDNFFYVHEERYGEEADRFYISIQDDILKKMKLRGISTERGKESKFMQQAVYVKERYVNFPIPGNIEVCGDRLLLVAWEKPVIAVLIHSKSLAEHFKKYFDSVWAVAKP